MNKILFICLTLALNVLADTDQNELNARIEKVDRFAYEGPIFLSNLSIEKIRALDKIKLERKEEIRDKYSENKYIPFYSFIFKNGLEVNCRFVAEHVDGPHVQLVSVAVTSNKWKISKNLGVGAELSSVLNYFGKSGKIEKDTVIYEGLTETVRFTHKQGKIVKVEFFYYTG